VEQRGCAVRLLPPARRRCRRCSRVSAQLRPELPRLPREGDPLLLGINMEDVTPLRGPWPSPPHASTVNSLYDGMGQPEPTNSCPGSSDGISLLCAWIHPLYGLQGE